MIHITTVGEQPHMRPLMQGLPVQYFLEQLEDCDDLWNKYGYRNIMRGSPHEYADDIWIRANSVENFDPHNPHKFLEPHNPIWYPEAYTRLSTVEFLNASVLHALGMLEWEDSWERIGGVLVTRVPAGESVNWHIDGGWNQKHYDTKVAVMLRSNKEQAFCFGKRILGNGCIAKEAMVTEAGDAFCFWNEHPHCVVNPSKEDRLTLIFSIRTTNEN